ncbi:MAG: homocysteine S-methyltransferase family protein [Ruminococcaceae bacterium]|nr:homocysteine S-methyltransferase family protein [Oscillospiraceae bacterium]
MEKNCFLLDGAMGTSLWAKAEKQLPVWRYNTECPEIVSELHREYIEAGSDYIFTNTFSANRDNVAKSGYSVAEVVKKGVELAKKAAEGTNTKVVLDIGPLSELLEPYGDLEEEDAIEIYEEQIGAGAEMEPDVILFETFMDKEMLRIAVSVAERYNVPIWCSMSFDQHGRTMMGNSVKDMIDTLSEFKVEAVGLNCSLGPDLAVPVIAQFKEYTDLPLIFKPNAGKNTIKDGKVITEFSVETFVEDAVASLEHGVKYLGGCCGSSPEYIKAMKEKLN